MTALLSMVEQLPEQRPRITKSLIGVRTVVMYRSTLPRYLLSPYPLLLGLRLHVGGLRTTFRHAPFSPVLSWVNPRVLLITYSTPLTWSVLTPFSVYAIIRCIEVRRGILVFVVPVVRDVVFAHVKRPSIPGPGPFLVLVPLMRVSARSQTHL